MGRLVRNPDTDEVMVKTDKGWEPARQARNKSTGEVTAFDGDQWVDIPSAQPKQEQSFKERLFDPNADLFPKFSGMTDELTSGFTFGLSDKAAGLGKVASDYLFQDKKDFDPKKSYFAPKRKREAFRKQNPKLAATANIAGTIANPVSARIGKYMGQAKSLPRAMGRGATGGAMIGAAEGAGQIDLSKKQFRDRPYRAIAGETSKGAMFGGAMGAGFPPIVSAGKGAINLVGDLIKSQKSGVPFFKYRQQDKAMRKVVEALNEDGLKVDEALKKIEELGPEGALLDAGENSRMLAYAVRGRGGEGTPIITKKVMERQQGTRDIDENLIGGQTGRLLAGMKKLVPENLYAEKEALRRSQEAERMYAQAYKANQYMGGSDEPFDKVIDRIMKIDDVQTAMKQGTKTLQNEMKNLSRVDPELTKLAGEQGIKTGAGVGRGFKLEFLDKVKRTLYDMAEKERDSVTGKITDYGKSLHGLRAKLTKAMDDADVTPDKLYSKARALAGDTLENEQALREGQNFMSKAEYFDPHQLMEKLAGLSPEARHRFRIGAAHKLTTLIGDMNVRSDVTKKITGIPNLEAKIKMAFGDKNTFKKYRQMAQGESTMFDSYAKVMTGSPTAEKLEAIGKSKVDPSRILQGVRDVASLSPPRMAGGVYNILAGIKDKIAIGGGEESRKLAELLAGRDISQLSNVEAKMLVPEFERILKDSIMRSTIAEQGIPFMD